jgi:hypothetical protein
VSKDANREWKRGGEPDLPLLEDEVRMLFIAAGWEPRSCDVAVVMQMGGTIKALAEYLWDHILGEPHSPSPGRIVREATALVRRLRDGSDA